STQGGANGKAGQSRPQVSGACWRLLRGGPRRGDRAGRLRPPRAKRGPPRAEGDKRVGCRPPVWGRPIDGALEAQEHLYPALNLDSHAPQTLQARLQQQAHWRQAAAVQGGEQPATDPDAYELEELRDGLRLYRVREQHREVVEGRRVLV